MDLAAKDSNDHAEASKENEVAEEAIEDTEEVVETAEEAMNGFCCELCISKFSCLLRSQDT